jgi:hypothetical protein
MIEWQYDMQRDIWINLSRTSVVIIDIDAPKANSNSYIWRHLLQKKKDLLWIEN